jgi:succinate dehydrogenase flavin-adding protein (antitoxin of CptAB toxin-antitoxin module)
MRRALLYRSRQTGWLETDLIMGRWAAEASTFSKVLA